MAQFIYKVRPDGLAVLDVAKLDERLRIAARWLARTQQILVVGRKPIAHQAVERFAELVGARAVTGRFMPGSLTNPTYAHFFEAQVLLVSDPLADRQAVQEAVKAGVPIIAVCDTFNDTRDVDLIIPANNKGRKAVATLFWILTREVLKLRQKIKTDEEFKWTVEQFAGEKLE
jgi:small subunit ribosomal protein S2